MFASPQTMQPTGLNEVYNVQYGNDKGLYVEFEKRPIFQEFASKQAGRAIYKDETYATIHFAGDKTKIVVRPAKLERVNAMDMEPTDPERFPRQWAAFQQMEEQIGDGLPVTEWPPITKSQAMELKAMNIHTVEQLAAMPDSGLSWFGARSLRDLASAWLDENGASKIVAERDELKNTVSVLQQQIAGLISEMGKLNQKSEAPVIAPIAVAEPINTESAFDHMQESALVKRKAGRPKFNPEE